MTHLFDPIQLRGLSLPNRIGMSPMCQYSSENGFANDWHSVHYGSHAVGGSALMFVEASAVTPEGRISPADLGIWDDAHIEPLARITRFARQHGSVMAMQLAHAGRKASVSRGWEPQHGLLPAAGGWQPVAPSALSFGEGYAVPQALDQAGIDAVVAQFSAAARRALQAGFQIAEVHAAHGYLLHQFLSPLTNQRTDAYGGSLDNRSRLLREVVSAVRAVWPENQPLFVRVSATDWVEGGWDIEQTIAVCRMLKTLGVDVIDVSSGGLVPSAKIPVGPGFQVPFAERIRREADIATACVGLITTPEQANRIIGDGQADIVLLGRELLRNPYWPRQAAHALGQIPLWPNQYLRAAPQGAVGY